MILFDVVLGYGAHPDPAPELAEALEQARALATAGGRQLALVGSVCGTAGDPQGLRARKGAARGGRAAGREQCPGGAAGRDRRAARREAGR